MRSLLIVLLAAVTAHAQPGADPADALARCKAQRQEIAREAQSIADRGERTRIYLTMPNCHVGADGIVEVIVPPPPPAPDTTPYSRHIEGAIVAGGAFVSTSGGANFGTADGLGPYLELEGAWQAHRHVVISVHAGFTNFEDPSVVLGFFSGQGVYHVYDLREHIYEGGARAYARYGALDIGVGFGAQLENGQAYGADYHEYSDVLALLDAVGSVRVWRGRAIAIDVRALATVALGSRDVQSLRLAAALRFK